MKHASCLSPQEDEQSVLTGISSEKKVLSRSILLQPPPYSQDLGFSVRLISSVRKLRVWMSFPDEDECW